MYSERLKLPEPVAFVVHVPSSLNQADLRTAGENVLGISDAAFSMGLVPYVEATERVLLPYDMVPDSEKKLRHENLFMLQDGQFDSVHISGNGISEYVREIVWYVVHSGVDVFYMPNEGSILDRYFKMLNITG